MFLRLPENREKRENLWIVKVSGLTVWANKSTAEGVHLLLILHVTASSGSHESLLWYLLCSLLSLFVPSCLPCPLLLWWGLPTHAVGIPLISDCCLLCVTAVPVGVCLLTSYAHVSASPLLCIFALLAIMQGLGSALAAAWMPSHQLVMKRRSEQLQTLHNDNLMILIWDLGQFVLVSWREQWKWIQGTSHHWILAGINCLPWEMLHCWKGCICFLTDQFSIEEFLWGGSIHSPREELETNLLHRSNFGTVTGDNCCSWYI